MRGGGGVVRGNDEVWRPRLEVGMWLLRGSSEWAAARKLGWPAKWAMWMSLEVERTNVTYEASSLVLVRV